MESIAGAWILNMIENKLDDHQHDALKQRWKTHALVDMVHHWSKAIYDG